MAGVHLGGVGRTRPAMVIRIVVTGGALWLWSRGDASAGDMTYVVTSYLVLNGYLRDIGQYVHQFQRAVNEMEELVELHGEPLGVADRPDARPIPLPWRRDPVRGWWTSVMPGRTARSTSICPSPFRQASGSAWSAPRWSGKTSFVKLVQRLYDVDGGRGDDRRSGRGAGHAGIATAAGGDRPAGAGAVPPLAGRQYRLCRPGATQAEIKASGRLANAHDFIAALPKGYRTPVGERGVKLSGGERQRVAIARAFLADAPILNLDEATSSLDSEARPRSSRRWSGWMVGRTAIVNAHRLSTVRALDRILVFRGEAASSRMARMMPCSARTRANYRRLSSGRRENPARRSQSRCLIPGFDGASSPQSWKNALWDGSTWSARTTQSVR